MTLFSEEIEGCKYIFKTFDIQERVPGLRIRWVNPGYGSEEFAGGVACSGFAGFPNTTGCRAVRPRER